MNAVSGNHVSSWNIGRLRARAAILVFPILVLLAGCGSGRKTVEGYGESALNDKRVFLLLPAEGEVTLGNPGAFAYSRGIGEAGAPGRIATEVRTELPAALDAFYTSNTFLDYGSQTVGAVVPLNPTADLPKDASASWNWDKVREAAKQGNIDYLLVIHSIRVENDLPGEGDARGKETLTATFSLLDPAEQKVMTSDEVRVQIKDPRKPSDTYTRTAEAMSKKLPFYTGQ